MGDNYLNLKRKVLIQIILKVILLGLATGIFVGSAIALVQRLTIEKISVTLCVLVGFAVFLVVGGVYALIKLPTEKRIARELDQRLALKEKVQTMLAYKENEGSIYELQREDTNNSLVGAKISWLSIKFIVIIALVALMGVGMMLSAILIPEKIDPPVVIPDVPFKITELQISAIEELIAYVNATEMDEPYKENTVKALTTLLDELKTVTNVADRDVALESTIVAICYEMDASSSAIEIINEIWKSNTEATKLLAKAINYYDWPKIDEWEKFVAKITEARVALNYIAPKDEKTDEQKKLEATKALFQDMSDKIIEALSSSKISEDDELYITLLRLATANEVNEELGTRVYGLQTLSTLIDTLGYADAQRELDTTFTVLNNELYRVLSQHKINTSTGEYAITRICVLFNYPLPKFERPQLIDFSEDGSGSDDSSSGNSGAIGEGTEYGSDDLVYDPFTGEYVEYGVILDKYYKLMFGKLENGQYTDEEKKAIEKYFDILYGGFDNKNEENEN